VVGRGIDQLAVDSLSAAVEEQAREAGPEVSSEWVGLAVLDRLRTLDPVSYVRFASVYKDFANVSDFAREVGELEKSTAPKRARKPRSH
jgi:transcriptional repressor NrdR